jgi:hypothetical protein
VRLAKRDKSIYLLYPEEDSGSVKMTATLEFSPESEAALKAQAQARGLTLEQRLMELAGEHVPPASIARLQRTNPGEWARQFDEWINSHDPNLPVLSDEAMSRESIYPDHV